MTARFYHLYIDYDEISGAYQGIKLRRDGDPTLKWQTGNPAADWKSCADFAGKLGLKVEQSSSVQGFIQDIPGWSIDLSGMLRACPGIAETPSKEKWQQYA